MAYNYPFQLLNAEVDIPLLTSSKDATYAYINCLALLQCMLLPLSTHPRFQDVDSLDTVRDAMEDSFARIPAALLKTIKKNQETALDIITEANAKEGVRQGATSAQISKAADDYLDGLVIQYSILRQARFEETPLEMSAAV
ncbi:MAG: hypothetical protein ACREA9_19200 [Pyrinomonadaceae bacterium]